MEPISEDSCTWKRLSLPYVAALIQKKRYSIFFLKFVELWSFYMMYGSQIINQTERRLYGWRSSDRLSYLHRYFSNHYLGYYRRIKVLYDTIQLVVCRNRMSLFDNTSYTNSELDVYRKYFTGSSIARVHPTPNFFYFYHSSFTHINCPFHWTVFQQLT